MGLTPAASAQLAFDEELIGIQRDFATALVDAAAPALACASAPREQGLVGR